MWLYLKNKKEIYKLNKAIDKLSKKHTKELREARKNKVQQDTIYEMRNFHSHEYFEYYDEIRAIKTNILRRKANKYNIPMPDYSDDEVWCTNMYGERYLEQEAEYKLSKQIRQDFKERLEIWIPIITALTGLIGVFIGLIAVIAG